MTFILPHTAMVTRRVVITPADVDVVDAPLPEFRAYLSPPDPAPAVNEDASPRELPPRMLRFAPDPVGPGVNGPARAGERVEVEGETYELLGMRRNLLTGRRVMGHEVAVQSVALLYPYAADLQEGTGDLVTAGVPIAMWAPLEQVVERSGWEVLEGECPVEFKDDARSNRHFLLGGARFNISRSWVPPDAPRTRMVLRRRDPAV